MHGRAVVPQSRRRLGRGDHELTAREQPAGALVYDDGCAFCRASASRIAAHMTGRAISLPASSLSDEQLSALRVERAELQRSALFIDGSGRVFTGHLAIAQALKCAAGWRRLLGRSLAMGWLSPIAALAYRFVARVRHRLG